MQCIFYRITIDCFQMTPSPHKKPSSTVPDSATSKTRHHIQADLRVLASFRYTLRKFLRFSEKAARLCGVTPQQHQLMLGVAGYTERGWATLSELAEFLQERHNSVVGLVERAARRGLVHKTQGVEDRRIVVVSLTRSGDATLLRLTQLHKEEVQRVQEGILSLPKLKPGARRPHASSVPPKKKRKIVKQSSRLPNDKL